MYAFMAGVPNRRGGPAKVSSFGNVHAEARNGHANFYVNMDPTPIKTTTGKRLPGFRGKERDIKAVMHRDGQMATIDFPLEFGRSPKVARGLVKLAAEYLCWAMGRDVAAKAIDGPVADFVRHGKGYRPIVLFGSDVTKYEHHFGHIGQHENDGWWCAFRLAHFHVFVDLTTNLGAFRQTAHGLYETMGPTGWTTLPLDAVSIKR
ncbi:MAG: hypothetical protein IPO08_05795 [Xanthomonadales bacterium]|nr:hypothetical protein [Xanthomonadales bacterium]